MPSENRNRQRVALFDSERLVVDDAAAVAGEYVIDLIVKMAVRPRAFAGRNLRDDSRERLGVEAEAAVFDVSQISHRRRLAFELAALDQHAARAPAVLFRSEERRVGKECRY